jgi:acetyl/propionyl-CoA carboxylase alpha subunit
MISKLITYGKTRVDAMDKMIDACEKYKIFGLETTLGFGRYVMKHNSFRTGNFDTNFINDYFTSEKYSDSYLEEEEMGAIFTAYYLDKIKENKLITQTNTKSNWKQNRLL